MVRKSLGFTAVVAMFVASGCNGLSSSTCKVHCWEHRPVVEDSDDDGRFDALCENGYGTPQLFPPPIPTAGFFLARACTETQSEHDTIKAAIDAILAEETLSATEFSTYNSIVDEIADAGFEACVSHLIGDDPATPITEYSDIDPLTPGGQSCVLADAEGLCDTYVRAVILDELGEVLGGGDEVPTYSIPGEKTLGSGAVCDFVPELGGGDTDTGGVATTGATSGGGSGADASSGVDSSGSGTGAGAFGPWGDLPSLVSCNGSNVCVVDRALVDNVTANFSTFYAEGVSLTLVTNPADGVQVTGLDSGEDSTDLADAFGIEEDDVIIEVDGMSLDSEEAAAAVLEHLAGSPSPVELTIVRIVSNMKTEIDFELRFTN